MTRRADETNRSALLDRIVDYVVANGVGSLSLRPLAKDLGVSAASLMYHFRSKEELTVEILRLAGNRQRALFETMRTGDDATPNEVCRAVWNVLGASEARSLFRLFFEVYALAAIDPQRFPGFFPAAVENWLGFLARPFARAGMDERDARAHATIMLATFRGFLLDLCATNDTERVDRAVDVWLTSWR